MEKISLDESLISRINKILENDPDSKSKYGPILSENNMTLKQFGSLYSYLYNISKHAGELLSPIADQTGIAGFAELAQNAQAEFDQIPMQAQHPDILSIEDQIANISKAIELFELDKIQNDYLNFTCISKDILTSIDFIISNNVEDSPENIKRITSIKNKLQELIELKNPSIDQASQLLEKFDKLNENYTSYVLKLWDSYLSESDINSDNFRMVAHCIKRGNTYDNNFSGQYMSAVLLTSNIMGLFDNTNVFGPVDPNEPSTTNNSGGPFIKNNYGLIIKPKNIIVANDYDTYTNNAANSNNSIFCGRPFGIKPPQEIETNCLQRTIERNHEMLNYDNDSVYPEIVLDDFEIIGIFLVSNGEHELTPHYTHAKKMADSRGLPLVEKDLSKIRKSHGLEPMTEKTKKFFFKNLLENYCNSKPELKNIYTQYSEEFINSHSEIFCEKYLDLKEQENYSTNDILLLLAEVTKNDIHFDKISQSIYESELITQNEEKLSTDVTEPPVKPEQTPIQQDDSSPALPCITTETWLNRFKKCYESIDKLSEKAKSKLLLLREELMNTIHAVIHPKMQNKGSQNKTTQDLDSDSDSGPNFDD